MKKVLKVFLYALLAIVVGSFAFIYVYYHSYSPHLNGITVSEKDLGYFQETYPDARDSFLHDISEAGKGLDTVETFAFRIPSGVDSGLIMDVCYIPPRVDTVRLLVLISGTHGIEGYTGSAIQQMFLEEFLDKRISDDTGILLVHAFNPYGFKYFRKATEYNVDLNRNCGVDESVFQISNTGYRDLYDLLCPSGKVNTNRLQNQFFYVTAVWKIIKESMAKLRQAALQGQYDYREGIYYGGNEFTPQTAILQTIFPEIFKPYQLIFAIDLHTGYGEIGKLHLFPNPEKNERIKTLTESLFEGHQIDWGDTKDFYTIDGDLCGYIRKVNPASTTLTMLFEFGTLNSQKTIGSLQSIQRMILENQGYNNGYKNNRMEKKVKEKFRDLYYPSSDAWRSEVIRQSREMLDESIHRFMLMEPREGEPVEE